MVMDDNSRGVGAGSDVKVLSGDVPGRSCLRTSSDFPPVYSRLAAPRGPPSILLRK